MNTESDPVRKHSADLSERLRKRLRLALRCAEEDVIDLETMDTICCSLSCALADLDDLEVITGLKFPAEADRAAADKGIKVYRGWLVYQGGRLRHAVDVNGQPLDPRRSRRVIDHCDSFGWGDCSPAASQLAIAILLEHFDGDAQRATELHRKFLAEVVAKLPREGEWAFTSDHVERAVDKVR